MQFKAHIHILPLEEILDPQGKSVELGLKNLNLKGITQVRIGKYIILLLDAMNEKEATEMVDMACKKLLANPIMENYSFHLDTIN